MKELNIKLSVNNNKAITLAEFMTINANLHPDILSEVKCLKLHEHIVIGHCIVKRVE
jgi:hypothetical protein